MGLRLVAGTEVRMDDPIPVVLATGVAFIYRDPLRGALALGGVQGIEPAILEEALLQLPACPDSRWVIRTYDPDHRLVDERAVQAQHLAAAFGVKPAQLLAQARSVG